jgi:hypothetical protein
MSQQYERRDGDAVLYMERNKKNERGPDWTGTVLLNGVEYRLSMWSKGNNGTMLAGKIEESRNQQSSQAPQQREDRGGFQRGGSDRGSFGDRSAGGFSGRDQNRAQQVRGDDPFDDSVPF